MLHERNDYNKRIQDSAGIIPDDEPVFLLRAQDNLAPNILREYAVRVNKKGNREMADRVWEHAAAMEKWRGDNQDKIKNPDAPIQQTLNL